uniref:Uncharacterized protein n=1 Tax=Arundo donax TaxID=35708 RepID=A0A0A9HMZ6_ARUDO
MKPSFPMHCQELPFLFATVPKNKQEKIQILADQDGIEINFSRRITKVNITYSEQGLVVNNFIKKIT